MKSANLCGYEHVVSFGVFKVVYTALIHGCAKLGLVDRAFATFEEMRLQPIKMDAVVLNLMIHLCGKVHVISAERCVVAR